MAILQNHSTQREIHLRSMHTFGRAISSDTLLASPYASQVHASIRWVGNNWQLHDHSRNGTWLNEQRLQAGFFPVLRNADIVRFGHEAEAAWIVEDLRPPGHLLWPLGHGGRPIALERSNMLPPGSPAEMLLVQTAQGQWLSKTTLGSRVLRDGDELRLSGLPWMLVPASEVTATQDNVASANACSQSCLSLHFYVSLDEEHVRLQVHGNGNTLDLGERAHHYALLTLARLRLKDTQSHQDSQAHGWIDAKRLARMLGQEVTHLNVQIHRIRKQFAQVLPFDAAPPELIERRRSALRLGNLPFRITRGSLLEADSPLIEPIGTPAPQEPLLVCP